ncbi:MULTISPECIES: hypothetical protein [Chryseobacterium]|nr:MULTISPECIES: hypothetical protein [Chryseobacterium]
MNLDGYVMQNDVILKGSQQRIFNNEHYILIACFYQKDFDRLSLTQP